MNHKSGRLDVYMLLTSSGIGVNERLGLDLALLMNIPTLEQYGNSALVAYQ